MDVRITSRHGGMSDAFRQKAEEKAAKLARYEPRLLAVDLLFDEDHGRVSAEVRTEVPGVPVLVARAEGSGRRAALDRVIRKMARRLRRERSKRVAHQAPPMAGAVEE